MKYLRVFILLCVVTILSGCAGITKEPITKTGFYFDTIIAITLYDTQDETLLDECFSLCERYEKQLSRTIADSDISRINDAAGQPVKVSETTIELLKKGIYYGELTNGAFDITIAPLSMLWDFKNNPGNVPSEADIATALSHVDYKNIVINENTVTLTDPQAAIDLGGIAKGYIADELKEYLLENEVKSALINLGGNVLTVGSKPDGSSFKIGIQKPFDKQNVSITSVSTEDSSVVTSGSYERYFEVDNILYHHILNTANGYPCDHNLYSVTILSEQSIEGDALSTACFALGLEDGIKFIQSLDHIDAIFITDSYEIIDTRKEK